MRKDHGRWGRISCQIYLVPLKVVLCREVTITCTGAIVVRDNIPASCIVAVTEIVDARVPYEAIVWDASLIYGVPWFMRHEGSRAADAYFAQPAHP